MKVKISVFTICVKAVIYLLLCHLDLCTQVSLMYLNESRYKQCGVTLHFSTWETTLKKILILEYLGPIEKSFLIDLLTTNKAIYRESLTLRSYFSFLIKFEGNICK